MLPAEVNNIIDLAADTFEEWKGTAFTHRSKLMMNAAAVLKKNKEDYSRLMTLEMGKPIVQSRAEVDKSAWVCDYYAENSEKFFN